MARHNLKQWRKYRKLTQGEVVSRLEFMEDEHLPTTEASLSRVENGKQPYTERLLEALAEIYQCESWELLRVDPEAERKRIEEQEAMRKAIAEGENVTAFTQILSLSDSDKQKIVRLWNAANAVSDTG